MQSPNETGTHDAGGRSGSVSGHAARETRSQRGLCLLGLLLFAIGAVQAFGGLPYHGLRALTTPLGEIGGLGLLAALVLLAAVPTRLIRAIPRAVLWAIAAVWLLFCAEALDHCVMVVFTEEWDSKSTLALMIAVFGLLLAFTNDPQGRIRPWFRRVFLAVRRRLGTHLKPVLFACLVALWLLNPTHSHETCVRASAISEECGAYGLAVRFTTLARDVFSPQSHCFNCYTSICDDLTRRIAYLQRKRSGQDPEFPSALDPDWPDDDDAPRRCFWRSADTGGP